jgi:isocitrate lyase
MWEASDLTEIVLNKMGYKFRFATYPVLLSNSVNTYDLTLKFSHEAIEAIKELKYNLANHPMKNFMKTIGVDKYQEIEKKYSPGTIKRIESSEGFKENS